MKKRIRTQPSNPYYTNEPAVATSLMADKAPVQNASLGNKPPKMVDRNPGRMSGEAGFVSKTHLPKGKGHINIPKLGTTAKSPAQTKLRTSGHSGAHQLGLKKIKGV